MLIKQRKEAIFANKNHLMYSNRDIIDVLKIIKVFLSYLLYFIFTSLHSSIWRVSKSYLSHRLIKMPSSVQFSSVTQSCPTLCNPMKQSMPSLPVHHQLPEYTQTHVHLVGDAIQSSHPLSSPSAPALNLSQHQGLYK